ncbi:MAG: TIGR04438 family Trp-rich protein [Saezia sp.]
MSAILPLIGILMVAAKYFDVSYLTHMSWWWCVVPFVLAFIYWEFIDPVFHFSAKSNSKRIRKEEARVKRQHTEEMLSENLYRKAVAPKDFEKNTKKKSQNFLE